MSVHELMSLARNHWKKHLPDKVKELQAEGLLEAETNAAANLAQSEIETLMKAGYQEHRGASGGSPDVYPAETGSGRGGRAVARTG